MEKFFTKQYLIRTVIALLSNIMAALGLTLLRLSCLGTDPFSAFNYNLSEMFGLPLVIFMFATHLFLFLIMFPYMKKYVGIGMVINMTVLGTSADLWKSALMNALPLRDDYTGLDELPLRIVLMLAGMILLVFFLSFYMASDTGMSPYDAFSFALAEKIPRFPFKVWRMLQDGTFLVLAFIVGIIRGNPWIVIGGATILSVFFIGPMISFFRKILVDPIIDKIKTL